MTMPSRLSSRKISPASAMRCSECSQNQFWFATMAKASLKPSPTNGSSRRKVMASLGGAILAVLLLIAPLLAGDLSTQTIALSLERQFAGPDISYIVVDGTGAIIAQRWSD